MVYFKGANMREKRILTDEEFREMVQGNGPEELAEAMPAMRREGRIQLFDDGTENPLVMKTGDG